MLPHPTRAGATVALLLALAASRPATAGAASSSLCYQKLSGLARHPDIEQLRLVIDGERLTGEYSWFPWQKDRRVGRLEGRLTSGGTAQVLYRFLQEGQKDSARLTIVFNEREARIRWPPPQPGQASGPPLPPILLPRHPCAELKMAPSL
jgi:hypothetical protein